MTTLLLCLVSVTASAAGDQPVILDGGGDPYASEFVFFGTQYGIYTFNRNSETWSRITVAHGLPANRANVLGLDEGLLWVGTDSGLASADVRIGDWQAYDLPGPVRAMAFDDRYVWAGSDSGLKRFDKFAETWHHRGDASTLDMVTDKGLLWIATAVGVLRYDAKFDRVDQMPAPADSYVRIINTPTRVWFVGRKYLVGHKKGTESWSNYSTIEVADFATAGDSVFVATRGKLFMYDPGGDFWGEIQAAKWLPMVNGLFATAEEVMLATAEGLRAYNTRQNTEQVWTTANGLLTDTLLRVHSDQRFTYVVSAGAIQFLDRQKSIWKHETLTPAGARKGQVAYLDDAGAHLRLLRDTDIRLAGQAYYSESRTFTAGSSLLPPPSSLENIGLSLVTQHQTGRALSLYYDDSDKDQVAYGLGYRGVGDDLLHRANGGRVRTEYSEFDLIPRFSTLGGNLRLKRGQHNLDLQAGKLQSELHSEFFTGRSMEKRVRLRDTDLARRVFYHIPPSPGHLSSRLSPSSPLLPSFPFLWDTAFVDDRNPATNTARTRIGFTVGSITGDFDPLVRGVDYFVDEQDGIIHFLSARKSADVLVLLTDAGARVVQSESVTGNELRNTYSFGQDITPGSFDLTILDTSGLAHPLSEFGLDDDSDGRVDPRFINHDLGLLRFPAPLIPDSASPSLYTLSARFLSQSVFYSLAHKPVVKNGETVVVDGEPMNRGSDYVMDYTSGILLFLRKDIVSDFSQVDVRYSSLEPRDPHSSLLASVQPDIAITDGIHVMPGFSRVEDQNVFHLSGRVEAGTAAERGLKFVPEVALNADHALAQDYSLTANYGIASASAQYLGFSSGFKDFGAADRRYGPLRHSAALSAGVRPLDELRLDAGFTRTYQQDTAGALGTADYLSGRLSYLNQKYPNGYVLVAHDRLPDGAKLRARANAGYELNALRSKLRLNGIIQNTSLDTRQSAIASSFEYITEATFSLPIPVQGNVRFRHDDVSGSNRRRERELRTGLGVDVVPGLFYTGSYSLAGTGSGFAGSQDLVLRSYFYNNLQIAPGRWWSKLSLVNFSVGTGSNFNEYLRGLDAAYSPPFLLFAPLAAIPAPATISSADNLRSLYGTVQLQPVTNLTLRARRSLNQTGTAYYTLPGLKPVTEDEVKIEYEPQNLGLFTALGSRRVRQSPFANRQWRLYFEWNRPWSRLLRTRLTTTYQLVEESYGPTATLRPWTLQPGVEALFRFSPRSYATVNFGLSRKTSLTATGALETQTSLLPGAGFSVNLFRFLYVQLNYQSNLVVAATASGESSTHTISTKLTGQF